MTSDTHLKMAAELEKAPAVALFSHVSPDGDCIGSMLAIGAALRKKGKQVYMCNPDPVPANLAFLPGAQDVQSCLNGPWPETLLFVDCADLERANLTQDLLPAGTTVLNIDHHVSNRMYGHLNWVDAWASASGEVALALIKLLQVEIDQDIATNLYTAILTDTGSFQFANTTAQTHRIVAELLDKQIDLAEIHHQVYDQKPLAQVKLLQRALQSLQLRAAGRLAIMTLTIRDYVETGAEDSLSEGLVNHARTIAGVEAAVLLREVDSNKVKVGLRSNRELNVNEIAAQFGGGGHQRAAGCTLLMPLDRAVAVLTGAIEEALAVGRK